MTAGPSPHLVGRRKVLALLAFLARHPGRPIRRERVADLLWGTVPGGTARQSLRQALSELREVLGGALVADAETVTLMPGAVTTDLEWFEQEVRAGRWAAAAGRWQGEFLPGLEDLASEGWREWLDQERAAIERSGRAAFRHLIEEAESRGAWPEALEASQRWRDLIPGDEEAVRVEARLLPLTSRTARPRDIRGLATPALTGRDGALARLEAAWQRVLRGEGRVVMVEGEPGYGTTRLLEEFARTRRASAERPTVVEARGYASERGVDHAVTQGLLRQLASAPGLAAAPPEALACLRRIAPELGERFPGLPAEAGGYTAATAMRRVLADAAGEGPLLVVIDDAATADPASLEVIHHLIRHPPMGCLLLLGGGPEGWGDPTGGDLRQAATHLERIALPALDRQEIETLIHSVAGFEPETASRLAGQIEAEVGGAPGDVVEVVRQLVEGGALSMDPAGRWLLTTPNGPLPQAPGHQQRILDRLGRLPTQTRRLLDAAAVLGEPHPAELIATVAGLEPTAASEAITELLARRWLRSPPSETGVLEFVEEGARRAVYGAMDGGRRRLLHRRAATTLAASGLPEPTRQALIAHHRKAARASRRGWRYLALAGLPVLALGLVILERGPRFPEGPVRVLVADVVNRTGDERFDRALSIAAGIALRESGRFQVFPRDQVGVTVERMGRPGADSILELPLAREVAERENLDAVLGLEVEPTAQGVMVTGRLLEPGSGATLAEARGTAATADAVVERLDDVLTALRRAAGESGSATSARRRLPFATTASLEALRAYADGRAAWRALDSRAALLHWQRAVELDSNFAMAVLALSDWHYWSNDRSAGEAYLARALALAGRLTERERLSLRATEAQRRGTPEEAVARLRLLAETFPDRESWNSLAAALARQARCEEALPSARRSLSFDSLSPSAWITMATCHQLLVRPDSALHAYGRAEAAQPGILYRGSLNHEWGRAHVLAGDTVGADSVFARMARQDNPSDRAFGLRSQGYLAMLRGRYDEATGRLHEAAVLSMERGAKVSELRNRVLLAEALITAGAQREAARALDRAIGLMKEQAMEPGYHLFLGHALIRAGRIREAEALAVELSAKVVPANPQDRSAQRLLAGWLALANGRPGAAIEAVDEDRYEPYAAYRHALLADALSQLGRVDSALAVARVLAGGFHFGYDSQDEWLRGLLRVARLAVAAGDPAEARRALSGYLERWRDGDPSLPEVQWARRELARMRAGEGG